VTWRNILRAGWIALFFTLAALAVAKLNLFGLEAASGERADDVAQRLGIVGYPYRNHDPDHPREESRPGQDRVRVIYIDDPGLEALKSDWGGWPPGYQNLALMIQDVATAPGVQPARAVFVDLEITGENLTPQSEGEFTDLIDALAQLTRAERSGEPGWGDVPECRHDALTKLACMVEWGGVPVILASGEGYSPAPFNPAKPRGETPRERLEAVALLAPILVDVRAYSLVSRRRAPDPEPGSVAAAPSEDYDLYPAAAMYAVDCLVRAAKIGRDVCGVPAIEKARTAALALRRHRQPPAEMPVWSDVEASWKRPAAVIWSQDASPRQNQLWAQTSENFQPNCKTTRSLSDHFDQAFGTRGAVAGAGQACIYTLSLGYDRIVEGLGLSRERDYPDLLGDKLVLIGVYFRGSDWVPTPLHGALPGVQYHAMALDNLLELGRSYRRNEGNGLGRGDLFASGMTFLLLFGVNLASIEKRHITGRGRRFKPLVAAAWYSALAVIIVAVLAFFMLVTGELWRSVIVNWIGILATAFAAAWFTARNDISGDLAGWMNRSRAGRAVVGAVSAFDRSLSASSEQDKE